MLVKPLPSYHRGILLDAGQTSTTPSQKRILECWSNLYHPSETKGSCHILVKPLHLHHKRGLVRFWSNLYHAITNIAF
ncbi:hypothetical protein RRG08_009585 [Elysia crispata]|uniref:Uncharacterized protein n=1 Tax=Elysia crispata TaxID=231223 RepID=A0AAE0XUL5_9GAST|nr:hypothetical protein RRG08_009585 [Elysia crispata]